MLRISTYSQALLHDYPNPPRAPPSKRAERACADGEAYTTAYGPIGQRKPSELLLGGSGKMSDGSNMESHGLGMV